MFKTGFVSVSFRPNSHEEIVEAAVNAKLNIIEWGGDVHSPAGDVETAEKIKKLSADAGISLLTYGSYFRIGVNPSEDFSKVIESARVLGVNIIRVWGYKRVFSEYDSEEWQTVVNEGRAVAEMAEAAGMKVCLECHNGTVTETYDCALKYMEAVDNPALRMYWQYNEKRDFEYNIASARAIAKYAECIHVFNHDEEGKKASLADGIEKWSKYIEVFVNEGVTDIPLLLEFMPDGKISTLEKEGAALNELVSRFN